MKIILFARDKMMFTQNELKSIFTSLEESGLEYFINRTFANKINTLKIADIPSDIQYDSISYDMTDDSVMISYGGDGSFLEAIRILNGAPIPVLGINFGHLGFLANIPKEEIVNVFKELKSGNYSIQQRTTVKVEGDFIDPPQYPYAINEFAIHRNDMSMNTVEVFVDNDRLATYRGDGVIISTPTGSTAYSLSVGGPIIAPDCGCFMISPIATHNLTMRPVVVPDSCKISVKVETREELAFVSLDNQSFKVKSGSRFNITKGEKPIFIVNLQNISFYDTLRNKMMWGLDGRDEQMRLKQCEELS